MHGGDEREHDDGKVVNGFMGIFPRARNTPRDVGNQPCSVRIILVELLRNVAADRAESWWARGIDCPAGDCLFG